MSNLKLDTDLLSVKPNKRKKLAYVTYAERITGNSGITDYIRVTQHDNEIFRLNVTLNSLYVTGDGWNSQTTARRLTRLLNRYAPDFFVSSRDSQKEYGLFLLSRSQPNFKIDIQSDVAVIDLVSGRFTYIL